MKRTAGRVCGEGGGGGGGLHDANSAHDRLRRCTTLPRARGKYFGCPNDQTTDIPVSVGTSSSRSLPSSSPETLRQLACAGEEKFRGNVIFSLATAPRWCEKFKFLV